MTTKDTFIYTVLFILSIALVVWLAPYLAFFG